jgi:hypothetical protein
VGRDKPDADALLTRAFVAVAVGLLLALWVLGPDCHESSARPTLPEFRALAGIPTLVI